MQINNNELISIGVGEIQPGHEFISFPDDSVFEPSMPEGKREGKVEVYSKDGIRLAVLFYDNDKLNGLCKLFEDLELKKQIKMS